MRTITLTRKPVTQNVAAVLEHGTGGIQIERCRIAYSEDEPDSGANFYRLRGQEMPRNRQNYFRGEDRVAIVTPSPTGRWPANIILSNPVLGPDSRFFFRITEA